MQGVRQKSTAGVSGIRRGHFFAVRRSRCPHICKREVINMLVAEYDYDTDIAVQREESLRIGIQQGIEQGIQQGFSDGSYQTKLETAKNLLEMGFAIEAIVRATGLSREEVESV